MLDLALALKDPEFWASHFGWRLEDRALKRIFGVDPDGEGCEGLFNHEAERARLYVRRLEDAGGDLDAAVREWTGGSTDEDEIARARARFERAASLAAAPNRCFLIRFAGDYALRIEYTPEPSVHYALEHPARREPLRLGSDGPHGEQPTLRWSEVELLGSKALAVTPGEDPAWCGRLLTPCGYTAEGDDAKRVRELLNRLWSPVAAIPPNRLRSFVDALGKAKQPLRWSESKDLGWTNQGENSRRSTRPEHFYGPWVEDDFRFFAAFTKTITGGESAASA
jgi:hypothetical protein